MRDQIGRVLSTRYRLVAPIGAGASAQVFLADDTRLRRRVAVKVLHAALSEDEAFLRRFRAEAQAAAALNHPNVLAVYDWGEDEVPYLVTEYLGGGSLRAMLDRGVRLSQSQALLVGLEASRALDVAHRRGFVHRDIKPANLLFGEEGRLRVADFGLARALAEAAWTEPAGAVLGTARYASPEQARGEAVDGKADIYSLALVLIEAVTGTVPFAADTTIATLMARVDKPVDVPAAMGPLRKVLERAGRPDPANRPDAGELAVGLMAAAEDLPKPARLPLAGATVELGDLAIVDRDPTLLPPATEAASGVFDQDGATVATAAGVASVAPLLDPTQAEPLTRRQARRLRKADKKAGKAAAKAAAQAEYDAGTRTRRRWPRVVVAVVLVLALCGAGAYAVVELRTPTHEVPTFVHLTEQQATALAAESKWKVARKEGRQDGTIAGEVIHQDPAPGKSLGEGKTVTLTVSLGNTLSTIPPDLAGKPFADAKNELEFSGFVVPDPTRQFDEQIAKDIVIGLPPGTPNQLPKQTPVTLIVSDGPAPRTVPAIPPNATYDQMAAALAAVQLVATQAADFSDTVPAGVVIRTNPAPGAQVPRGSKVTVVVSQGPPLIPIPDVKGKSVTDAAAILQQAGFTISGVLGDPTKEVLATDPPAGEPHQRGTPVRIIARG
jgi:serine/threonine-protein kinase